MGKYIIAFLLLLLIFSSLGCNAHQIVTFKIKSGNSETEVGFKERQGEIPASGPISIAFYQDNIFILDALNLKVNMYNMKGHYLNTIQLQRDIKYIDIALDHKGNILLLTNQVIYTILEKKEIVKKIDIPTSIKLPYYFNCDDRGKFVVSGLNQKGRIINGLLNEKSQFIEEKGYHILINKAGLVGINDKDGLSIIQQGKVLGKISLNNRTIPVGITETNEVFCVEPNKQGIKLLKKNLKGETKSRLVKYKFKLIEDDTSYLKLFKVIDNNRIIYLDPNSSEHIVAIVNFKM